MNLNAYDLGLFAHNISKTVEDEFFAFTDEYHAMGHIIRGACMMHNIQIFPEDQHQRAAEDWLPEICMTSYLNSFALYEFAFKPTINRSLNKFMINLLGTERSVGVATYLPSPVEALLLSYTSHTPLHSLWFTAKQQEKSGLKLARQNFPMERLAKFGDETVAKMDQVFDKIESYLKEIDRNLEENTIPIIKHVNSCIESAQKGDFDVNPGAIEWWSPNSEADTLIGKPPSLLLTDCKPVFDAIDKIDRRKIAAFAERVQSLTPLQILIGAEALPIADIKALRHHLGDDVADTIQTVVDDYVNFYALYRTLNNDHPKDNLLWYIANIQFALNYPAKDIALHYWTEIKPHLDGRIPTLWGLWILDLGRQIIHRGYLGNEGPKTLKWLHERERSLLEKVLAHDYGAEA